jgi:hypothetical protein
MSARPPAVAPGLEPPAGQARRSLVVDAFFDGADRLRAEFSEKFADPMGVSRERFVWDYWYVRDRYAYLRTLASSFFSHAAYGAFARRLNAWGAATLGCDGIIEPWLSYYVEGCHQAAHVDDDHGPWAFVFSLTDWERRVFSGGETLLLDAAGGRLAACFNRLIVFDPTLPHAVAPVAGTRDPLEARLVIHGWFREPELRFDRAVDARRRTLFRTALEGHLAAVTRDLPGARGLLVLRLDYGADGLARSAVLSNMLHAAQGGDEPAGSLAHRLAGSFRDAGAPALCAGASVTVPIRLPARRPERAASSATGVFSRGAR